MITKVDVEAARRILSRALLNQNVNEHTAIEVLNHLGGKLDLEHEVRYSKRSMLREEMELLVHRELSRRINE